MSLSQHTYRQLRFVAPGVTGPGSTGPIKPCVLRESPFLLYCGLFNIIHMHRSSTIKIFRLIDQSYQYRLLSLMHWGAAERPSRRCRPKKLLSRSSQPSAVSCERPQARSRIVPHARGISTAHATAWGHSCPFLHTSMKQRGFLSSVGANSKFYFSLLNTINNTHMSMDRLLMARQSYINER